MSKEEKYMAAANGNNTADIGFEQQIRGGGR
jgi:hypothetical protein